MANETKKPGYFSFTPEEQAILDQRAAEKLQQQQSPAALPGADLPVPTEVPPTAEQGTAAPTEPETPSTGQILKNIGSEAIRPDKASVIGAAGGGALGTTIAAKNLLRDTRMAPVLEAVAAANPNIKTIEGLFDRATRQPLINPNSELVDMVNAKNLESTTRPYTDKSIKRTAEFAKKYPLGANFVPDAAVKGWDQANQITRNNMANAAKFKDITNPQVFSTGTADLVDAAHRYSQAQWNPAVNDFIEPISLADGNAVKTRYLRDSQIASSPLEQLKQRLTKTQATTRMPGQIKTPIQRPVVFSDPTILTGQPGQSGPTFQQLAKTLGPVKNPRVLNPGLTAEQRLTTAFVPRQKMPGSNFMKAQPGKLFSYAPASGSSAPAVTPKPGAVATGTGGTVTPTARGRLGRLKPIPALMAAGWALPKLTKWLSPAKPKGDMSPTRKAPPPPAAAATGGQYPTKTNTTTTATSK